MSTGAPDPSPLDTSLRRLRLSALLSVGACAAGILLHSFRSEEATTDVERSIVWLAFVLAGASILTRRTVSRVATPRGFVALQIASNLAAVGLALLGAWLALDQNQSRVGLLYSAAAALLLLRPPARLVLRSPSVRG